MKKLQKSGKKGREIRTRNEKCDRERGVGGDGGKEGYAKGNSIQQQISETFVILLLCSLRTLFFTVKSFLHISPASYFITQD